MKKILVYGNPVVEDDSRALKVANGLDEFDVTIAFKPDDVLKVKGDFVILDVVQGIEDVTLIEDASRLTLCNTVTAHDFDLGFMLKLLSQAEGSKFRIIGIPQTGDIKAIRKKVRHLVSSL